MKRDLKKEGHSILIEGKEAGRALREKKKGGTCVSLL